MIDAPSAAQALDRDDVRVARGATGPLIEFNLAAVIVAADVHVTLRLARLSGERDDSVLLAAALAVRAPRLGHVHVDLSRIRETAAVDAEEPVDLAALPWPEPEAWIARISASPLVAVGETAVQTRPLRLLGSHLYLDRYWNAERRLAEDLRAIAADGRLTVLAGGPGTGKTTRVAQIAAEIVQQALAVDAPLPLIALAAPTGKAAVRLEEVVSEQARSLDLADPVREALLGLRAGTLHRLLGWRPGSYSRFRHDRSNRLAHEAVIVDETSMVSLTMMSRLVEAIRADARLVLVGDPGQLASIEAGAVLGDIVGPARAPGDGVIVTREHTPRQEAPLRDCVVVLDRSHRFGAGIARLAEAIRLGDGGAVLELLADPPAEVSWIQADSAAAGSAAAEQLAPVRDAALGAAREVVEAARANEPEQAIAAMRKFRLLCAHRRGPFGVSGWTEGAEAWLEAELPGFSPTPQWYVGRPLLVTENDHELRLYNGDTGVVVPGGPGRVLAAFERGGEIVRVSPARLAAVESVYAMTIHKSQGSQFDTAAVLLPAPGSRLLTRELLYTAVTRARERVVLVGTEEMVRSAVARPVARASGLRERLWGG
jgi:exodeoxyribonuclease V alpha subunit